ncbi:Norsolorinic acid ketoreductase [Lachnellula subtilissima]|uniref:Norsolorinic acid ketoreductase n=1 Tax=Lachnellula subtilissima TaxID=602034 RepID=A0A8H8RX68_9HELO|nr:Norsolorinic acid ketoreductase [Lachnellula subtilissima]
MSSSSLQTVLITGANRGIGKGIVTVYLSKSDVTVIAAVRDLESISTKALSSLPKAKNSSLITVKIDSRLEQDAIAAVRTLESEHSIRKIDVVIANAGTSASLGPVASITAEQVLDNVTVNSLGRPLFLFQATLPLLQKSSQPKFVVLGSQAGSIGAMEKAPAPMAAYGSSKAMAHYFVRKIHFEHKDIISFAIEPG